MILNLISILYLLLVCLGFWVAPGRIRPALLTIAGYIYVFILDIPAGVTLVVTSLLVYLSALAIEKMKSKKQIHKAKAVFVFTIVLIVAAMIIRIVRRSRIKKGQSIYSKTILLSNIAIAAGTICIVPFIFLLIRLLLT